MYIYRSSVWQNNLSVGMQVCVHQQLGGLTNLLLECSLKNNGQALVFVSAVNKVDRLSDELAKKYPSCRIFGYSAQHSHAEHEMVLNSFLDGSSSVIFATTSFGVGVDAPNIQLVIGYGGCHNIYQLVQEFGHAGRNGMHARTVFLYDKVVHN